MSTPFLIKLQIIWRGRAGISERSGFFDSPQSERFIKNGVAWYNDKDFVDYLNDWEMPEYKSVLIEELEGYEIPEMYKDCPRYNF